MSLLQKLAAYRFSRYFKLCFLVWDIVLLNLAIIFSLLTLYDNLDRLDLKEVRTISLLSNVFWVVLLLYRDSYRIVRIERIESILMRAVRMILIHAALIVMLIVILKFSDISRLRLLSFYLIFFVFLFVSRVVFMKLLKYIRAQGYNFKNVIIIGANDTGEHMRKILSKDLTYGYRVLGFFDDKVDPFAFIPSPLLGGFDAIQDYISTENVDEMYIALHIDSIKTINYLTELCERYMVRIKFIPDFQLYTKSRRVEISFYENTPVLMLRKEPLEITSNLLLKKAFDICFSFLVIVLIFPWLFPILIILIKLDSSGPVFFRQERSGRDNIAFGCLKFRTMQVNASADKVQATLGDKRVTKIGAFLRRTNMDELPQFLNVFWGNMSVVGPRPHMLMHTEQYSELINNYLVRHYAKPGITGWAQVNGFRGETKELLDMKDRVDYDIWYIENWSLILDLKIIFRTVFNVFQGEKNAY
ncbi:undecaprenyl-phosphate glucose phosphotransferase [Flavobacterium sp. XS2P24]|uniref:undecaprenyl-phosphate glucose phosphotransferase n=1 Tax=Flavobacterium sp. XS2P24 TaxID=3041249 RepID=UPI0024A8EB87|nr:undecaprenyl-phosphate glucose phosphotransferase [Flavobacterium sp. XS2P24]MDI6049230.1 undecaprenyl-phosphate glucose phosphotransferase [Flavobacterium sp. XS2P24]